MYLFSSGLGKHQVTAKVHVLDSGINITLYGGDKTHVGSVVVAIPRPSLQDQSVTSVTSSVINLVGHKDEDVARPLAEKLARTFGQVTVVTAGIHVEKATSEDITVIVQNVDEVMDAMILKLETVLR
ncbi:MAG: hypothetical protein ACOX1Y_01520 [Zhaonellaceae bacterium]|nr:hypothetical protein [Clostridia bacterium]